MFRCGIAYPRCRFIAPLLLFFAVIFDLIAIAADSGWVEDEDAQTHYANMWNQWRGRGGSNWTGRSLMEHDWAMAVAALMVIAFLILLICFIMSVVAMCKHQYHLLCSIGVLLFIIVILQVIALIVYPVHFNELIFEGEYFYSWAYGFGWGATIICFGCSILFCCLRRCEPDMRGEEKIKYIIS